MAKTVLVPIADGTEEIEAVCIIDILRRAGVKVIVASVMDSLQVTASRGVKLVADALIGDCLGEQYDAIALPGGLPGAEHLRDSEDLIALLHEQQAKNKIYAAICAAPAVVLNHHGLIGEKQATAYPGYAESFSNQDAVEKRVVVDANCISSQGPGTAIEFALTLVEMLKGKAQAANVAGALLVRHS
ncbi:DJ-1 family protein [candidate division KSB3 bacterium]|uniref:DJ-1 family protein n=1 Tax=candidate division KSB3 bacterium TaxID=2044937 RepID=A0A2G6E5I8_9BACT|nr:MAG: DJ-1 family protein [candidate division KSB3 bacterium]PIE29867.1 MAG: DJ-1 family protein [candidate division KSB3 bacterium]